MVTRWKNRRGGAAALVLSLLVLVALLLAACGGDDDSEKAQDAEQEPTPTAESGLSITAPDLNTGPGLDISAPGSDPAGVTTVSEGLKLPGCSDPDSTECPSPLVPVLDATASADGAQIAYYSRYWEALTGAEASAVSEGAVIVVRPSEANKFPLKGTFEVYFAESAAVVLDSLEGAEVSDWATEALGMGTVATVSDADADPPVTTVYGVFDAGDGRAVVLRLTAAGKYSLDFHHDVYAAMLDSLTVGAD